MFTFPTKQLRVALALLLLAGFAYGENQPPAGSNPNAPRSAPGGNPPSTQSFPRGIQVFNDGVFDLDVTKEPKAKSAGGRQLGEEPDYNQATRQRGIDNCQAEAEKGGRAFKRCFDGQMGKSRDALQKSRGVSSEGEELRNQAPLDDSPKGEPAFRGVEVERSND